ncbi:MAG: glycosyltransferase family A protein [Minwuia sp.]|nr:glycosyltransferase family A protein [Minwuia sp.]
MSQGNGTTKPAPTVSVLMTAYNRADFIADAMGSVLASDFTDFELIVVDDGSSDRTVEIARELEATDSRVRVYQNEKNLGDYPNRKHAASLATGKYLKYVDSDDMIYPWGLGVFVRCMEKFPEAGFGLSAHSAPDRPHPMIFSPAEAYREEFHGRELFGRAPGSGIIRRDAYEAVGGFSGMRQLGDMEFWLKIGARYPVVTLPPALVWDRVHGGQEKNADSDTEKAAMRADVVIAALNSPDCPLDMAERQAALEAYRSKLHRPLWRELLHPDRIGNALTYRRTVLARLQCATRQSAGKFQK